MMTNDTSQDPQESPVLYRLGLMSDTHMPERWNAIPATLIQAFAEVDMILHAGDLGELWVLDQLSEIAPVVAVHGNDEPPDTPHHLPLKQIVTVAGQRILVWHGHYSHRIDELESRRDQAMRPKLERIARHGRQSGVQIVHFGHWHIPLVCHIEGVTLVNAGGIASGNFVLRQLVQTVAILTIYADGRHEIAHIDLADLQLHHPATITDVDFITAAQPYTGSILSEALQAVLPPFRDNSVLFQLLRNLAPRCWWGGQQILTHADLITELERMTPQTPESTALLAELRG